MSFDRSNIMYQFINPSITPLLPLIPLPQLPKESKMIHIEHDLSLYFPLLLLLFDLIAIQFDIQFLFVFHETVDLSHHDLLS